MNGPIHDEWIDDAGRPIWATRWAGEETLTDNGIEYRLTWVGFNGTRHFYRAEPVSDPPAECEATHDVAPDGLLWCTRNAGHRGAHRKGDLQWSIDVLGESGDD